MLYVRNYFIDSIVTINNIKTLVLICKSFTHNRYRMMIYQNNL